MVFLQYLQYHHESSSRKEREKKGNNERTEKEHTFPSIKCKKKRNQYPPFFIETKKANEKQKKEVPVYIVQLGHIMKIDIG